MNSTKGSAPEMQYHQFYQVIRGSKEKTDWLEFFEKYPASKISGFSFCLKRVKLSIKEILDYFSLEFLVMQTMNFQVIASCHSFHKDRKRGRALVLMFYRKSFRNEHLYYHFIFWKKKKDEQKFSFMDFPLEIVFHLKSSSLTQKSRDLKPFFFADQSYFEPF